MAETENLKLFKHDEPLESNENQFDVDKALNKNWDKIDVFAGEMKDKSGNKLSLEIDTVNYIMTLKLLNQDDVELDSKTIDFPLESVVVNGRYEDGNVILTLQNETEISFSVAELVNGLISQETFDNAVKELQGKIDECVKTTEFQESQETQDTEITKLQEENEMLKGLLPTVTGKGEDVILKGTGEMPFKKFAIEGNSYQETSEQGKNILDLTKLSQAYIDPKGKVDNRSTNEITFSMTEQLAENAQSNFIYRLGTFPAGTYYLKGKIEILEGTDINKKIVANVITEDYSLKGQLTSNGKESATINLTEETALNIAFYIKQNNDTDNSLRKVRFYDLQISKEDVDYEPFVPNKPSFKYPSEIKAVGENGSIAVKVSDDGDQLQEITVPIQQPMLEGDYFDLEKGKEVHNWDKTVLDGENNAFTLKHNNIKTDTQGFFMFELKNKIVGKNGDIDNCKCDYLKNINNVNPSLAINETGLWWQSNSKDDNIYASLPFTTLEDANDWLKNNTITIYYKTKTPTELDLTEDQKKALQQLSEAKTYEDITHIFSEDEVSPTFDVEAYAKIFNASNQVQSETSSEPLLEEPSMKNQMDKPSYEEDTEDEEVAE